jgi:hypothetical protein
MHIIGQSQNSHREGQAPKASGGLAAILSGAVRPRSEDRAPWRGDICQTAENGSIASLLRDSAAGALDARFGIESISAIALKAAA